MQRPNVLFVLSDQHNAKCLGHKGHPDVKTPHLDRLAHHDHAAGKCSRRRHAAGAPEKQALSRQRPNTRVWVHVWYV